MNLTSQGVYWYYTRYDREDYNRLHRALKYGNNVSYVKRRMELINNVIKLGVDTQNWIY